MKPFLVAVAAATIGAAIAVYVVRLISGLGKPAAPPAVK